MRRQRWRKVSMIFQAAMNALNPVKRVEDQVMEAVRTHLPELPAAEAQRQVARWFARVGIPDNRRRDYPHQYSGGMRQRAVIAMALSCRPALVIADEPTTALDVIVQDQILSLLSSLRRAHDMSILLISHDISVVADVCDRIGVLYAGQMVESGTRREVFEAPAHPYTRALLAAHITLADRRGGPKAVSITGPEASTAGEGCRFSLRCPRSEPRCRQSQPSWHWLSETHGVRCDKCA
jgi:peptide/nickel transport system ATP-binding protein